MRKLFALFLALTLTAQLTVPAWAETVPEETGEVTEASEIPEEAEEKGTEETEEEIPEETTEATEEEPSEETAEVTEATEPTLEGLPEEEELPMEEVPGEEAALYSGEDVLAAGTCGGSLNWVLTADGTMTISGSGKMEDYSYYGMVPWYDYTDKIVKAVVESGVTRLGNYAFYGCRNMTGVTLPEGVTSIGARAFAFCGKLSSVTLPESVTSIDFAAFEFCGWLNSVTLPEGVTKIGGYAFRGCDSLKSITIPKNVTTIGECTFYGCSWLNSVTIPESVTSIGREAFRECTRLTSVSIPEGVTSIENGTFDSCKWLTSVTIPESVTSIGENAFRDCGDLSGIVIPESVTYIGIAAFSNCSSLTEVTIPAGVTSIEGAAFSGCSGLTGITIPAGVTEIGWSAFSDCSGLTSLTIPAGVTSIGDYAFSGCSSLTKMEIPEGVESIEGAVFSGCSGLTSVTIPESVTSIGDAAFSDCSSLGSVTIPAGVTSIGSIAFSGCSSLTGVMIPEGVTTIEWGTFSNCVGLTGLVIPAGVTSIMGDAFSGCSGLISVTIPDSVAIIDEDAFYDCLSLKDVYYGGTEDNWNNIDICDNGNASLLNATIHYQIQSVPEIRPVDTNALDGGETLKLTLWSVEQDKEIPAAWSLAEGDEAYATITSNGTLTAKATLEPVKITVIAEPTNGEPRVTKIIRINPKATALLLMLDGIPLEETLDVDMYDWETFSLTAVKNTMEEAQGIRWTTSKKDVAQVDANGVVTLLKPGTTVIQATDDGKLTGKVTLNVTYTDKSPRLGASTLNLNTALSGGVTVDFVEAYGNYITEMQLSDDRFDSEYIEDRLTIRANQSLKNGTYPVTLRVTCADEREYTYPLTIKVTSTLPKPTVKQTAKLNLFYKNSTAPLTVTVPGQTIENVELTDTEDFTIEPSENGWEIVYKTENPKPDTKGTLNITLEGYQKPVKVALTVGTVSTAPMVKLSAASSTINSGMDLTTRVRLLDKSGQPLELENPAVESDNVDVSIDGNLVTITLDEAKSTTVTMYLQDSTWAKTIKLTHKVTVSNKKPTLKPAGNLTLNSLFTARTAETAMVLSQSNLSLADVDFASTAKEGSAAWVEAQKLELGYDGGYVTAQIVDADNVPKAGTYSFTCTGILETGESIPGGTLKVTVSAVAPKVKLSATSVKLNQFLAGEEQGTVTVTAPEGYHVVRFEEMPEEMDFDSETGILTVMLQSASDKGRAYTLSPVVRDEDTDEEVTLPTKLSFKVQAYNSPKLGVSLSAKGKLDTQTDGEITYTVTKLTNCLGTVEDMILEGNDKDLFQASMDYVNGKSTVHLTLKNGETYATNKSYKVQFKFYACGQKILSPVQTVKVTQTALKVTAPKTVTYYQAQKSPLRVVLTANVPMDKVTMNSKTAKEFREAVGDMTLDGSRLEFEITNPGALKAGKSYSVVLDATSENNASNVKPTTVKLTVKVQK